MPNPFQHNPPAMHSRQWARPRIGLRGTRDDRAGPEQPCTHLAPSCILLHGKLIHGKATAGVDTGHMCPSTTCAWCCGGGKTTACGLPPGTLGMRNRWVHSPATVSPRSGRSPQCHVPVHHCHSHALCQGYRYPQEPWGLVTPSLPPVMGHGCPHSRCCCFERDAGSTAGAYWRKWVDGPQGHWAPQYPQSGCKGPVLPERGC